MPSWSNPLELRDGTIIYGGAGYFVNYYWLISIIPGFLFSFYGLIILTYNYTITPFLIIGVGLQTLLWFPDKLNKFWPLDIRTWKGFGLLVIFLIIIMFILAKHLY